LNGLAGAQPAAPPTVWSLCARTIDVRRTSSALLATAAALPSAPNVPREADAASYRQTIQTRAEKIAAQLGLPNPESSARVSGLIARQYLDLQQAQAARDARLASIRSVQQDPTAAAALIGEARRETEAAVAALHSAFLARLAGELSAGQIDRVKDRHDLRCSAPHLSGLSGNAPEPQRRPKGADPGLAHRGKGAGHGRVHREREHAWFGKYKGRINNYLAEAGFNLKQAEKEMFARASKSTAGKS
jgi:hypothetical protein